MFELFLTPHARTQLIELEKYSCALGSDFAGLGLVFCRAATDVPNIPIYNRPLKFATPQTFRSLITSARKSFRQHDGFHLVTPDWQPLRPNVYLACKIPAKPIRNPCNQGSRYLTALSCSSEPGVLGCITVSSDLRHITLFQDGVATLFDDAAIERCS